MSEWAVKKFWKTASVAKADDGFKVQLDGRDVRTPAKALLVVPTEAMADAIRMEWDAQDETVNPESMPVTRAANSAIDKVSVSRDAVVDMLAEYGDSDLLCYRAAAPQELVTRQTEGWDPVLKWAENDLNARMGLVSGVMHAPQPPESLERLRDEVTKFDNFALAGLHDLVSLSGSLVLGLAVCNGHLSAEQAWDLSRIDENWQIEQWGSDDEAAAHSQIKRMAFLDAARFFEMTFT